MRSVLSVGLILCLAFVVLSCAKPPTQELDAAQAALDAAKTAEADIYAPDTYRSAKTTLDDARAKVDQKDYEGAKIAAVRAKELAEQASSQSDTSKRQTRDEAQALVNRLSSGIADARTALDSAPRGKGADEDLDQLRADLGQAESSLAAAKNSLNAGKFKDALAQAQSAESKLSSVQGAVQTAMQKVEEWKKQHRPWYEL